MKRRILHGSVNNTPTPAAFRDSPHAQNGLIETVRVVVVPDRHRMFLRTPRYLLASGTFDALGSDRKTAIRNALLYVREHHSFGGQVALRCGVINGERVKSHVPRIAFRVRTVCFACPKREQLTNHHIVPRSRNGLEDGRNISVLCQPCHTVLEQKLEVMEGVRSPPLTYVDYVAALVTFTLARRHTNRNY